MSSGPRNVEVVYVGRRTRAIAGGAAWTLFAPLLFVATGKLLGPTGGGPPTWLGWALLAIVGTGIAGATVAYRRAKQRAALEVDGDSIALVEAGARRVIAKRSIENAMLVDGKDGALLLELALVGGDMVRLDFGNNRAARDALASFALEKERSITRIRLYEPSQEILINLTGGGLGAMLGGFAAAPIASFLGALAPFFVIGCMIPAMLFVARWLRRQLPEMRVGADGVAFRGPITRLTHFVSHDRIATIDVVRRDMPRNPGASVVELVTTDGERHVLGVHFAAHHQLAEALRARILEAIVERRAALGPLPSFTELERQGRPTGEWLEHLRDVARTRADYRHAQLTSEQLERLLTSGATPAEHRLGAAVILAARGEPEAQERIRIASETSADPAVSKALLAVAEGEAEEAAIAEALAATAPRSG